MDDQDTPREIIRGVLTTTSVSKSARVLRPRTKQRTAEVRVTPVNPPYQAEVASRLLTRSRSANKRKAPNLTGSATTPSDSTTPRTLISGFLQAAPVAKSVVKVKKPKTVPASTRGTKTVKKRASLHDDNTPRSTIQNMLQEAMTETPAEPIFSPSTETEDYTIAQETNDGEIHSPLAPAGSSSNGDPTTGAVGQTDERPTPYQADNVDMEVPSRLKDFHGEGEDAMKNTSGAETSEHGHVLSMATTDQALQTDDVLGGDIMQQTSGQWQDLVTPKLPLNIPIAGRMQLSGLQNDEIKRAAGEKKVLGRKPPTGKVHAAKSSKKQAVPRMPTNLVKSIFQHFSKAKLSKEALQAVENGSQLFYKQVSSDLVAFCKHAHRRTIELADVELLMKRQGFINERQSLYSLVEKYLPLEYREKIIPTVEAGNKIVLK